MKIGIKVLEDGGILFEGIDSLLFTMLSQIRPSAELDDPRVEARFYQVPSHDPEADALREDWKAFVQPDLNQARLALSEFHGFSEAEMGRQINDLDDPREYALLQVSIYGLMQEWLVSLLD